MKFVRKASDRVLSHCACRRPIATAGQRDCPRCGCGRPFTRASCRRAFTFGKVVDERIDESLLTGALAGEDKATGAQDGRLIWLSRELDGLAPGSEVVYLDGRILEAESGDPSFDGWFARHEISELPHRTARDGGDLDRHFGQPDHWLAREFRDKPLH